MRKRRFKSQEEFNSEVERQWLETARPPSRTSGAINTLIFVIVLVVLLVVAHRNRARIGALWHHVTGKAPPAWLMPETPKHGYVFRGP